MVILDSATGTGLSGFLDRYGNTRTRQELLSFWALHPNTRFSRLAILSAMECSKLDAERTLTYLVNNGLVNMCSDNGLTTYSLTSNENIRQMVDLFSTLDWGQRQIMFTHTHQVPGTCNLVSVQEGI